MGAKVVSEEGRPPPLLAGVGAIRVFEVRFPQMVWYNAEVRAEALRQIEDSGCGPCVLVGFSKSGLGAWLLARALKARAPATVIFDAPMARAAIPHAWGAGHFYPDEDVWRQDLPRLDVAGFRHDVPAPHRLVLISGAHFEADMRQLAKALDTGGVPHTFLQWPDLPHRWDAGWVELGLAAL